MIHAFIVLVLAALICGVFRYLHKEGVISAKKTAPRGRASPLPPPAGRRSTGERSFRSDTDKPAEQEAAPLVGSTTNESQILQNRLRDGMNVVLSGEASLPGQAASLYPTIEDCPADVRLQALSHIESLEHFPAIQQFKATIGGPETNIAEVSRIVISDPILSGRILQVANSAYYGMERQINSISHAIMIIGMLNVKAIVYHQGVLQALKEKSFRNNPTMLAIWQHANYASIYASYLQYLYGDLNMGNLFTLGLLHDIGKFIIGKLPPLSQDGKAAPRHYSADWTIAEEEDAYGINHALVGQLALKHWGLSPPIVNSVALHHALPYHPATDLPPDREAMHYLLVLFLADQAARLFAGAEGYEDRLNQLHPSYHSLIDRNKLSRLIVDAALMGQLREAEAIIAAYA